MTAWKRAKSETPAARHTLARDAYAIHYGNIKDIVMALDNDQFDWLCASAARIGCESIAEYLTEIVRDQYEESKEKNDQGGVKYRRADLPATDVQAMANPKVVAMVEALRLADAALSGKNVNMGVVKREVSAALTHALAHYKAQFIAMIEDDT